MGDGMAASATGSVEGGGPGDTAEIAEGLRRLRSLLEEEDVEGARAMVKELVERWPDSERVRHLAHVLESPRTRVLHGERGRPLHREHAWLRQHAAEYPGCWLAVFEDRLVAADPDLGTVIRETRRALGSEGALLHFQPRSDT
jgi:hypothetical protein